MTYINKEAKHLTRKALAKRINDFCKDNEILIYLLLTLLILGFTFYNMIGFFLGAK